MPRILPRWNIAPKPMIKELLKRQEGFSRFLYDDCGDQSAGYGRNMTQIGLSEEEAEFLLENDIRRVEKELERFPWFENLNAVRRAAVTSLNYNLGITRFLKFKLMLKALAEGDMNKAAYEVFPNSLYAKQVPNRAFEISEMMMWGEDAKTTKPR